MKYDPSLHHRRSIRLKGYDYSLPGAYFVTLVSKDRVNLFGEIINDVMSLNKNGCIILNAWENLPKHYPFIILDSFIIMPNHIHGIIFINDMTGRGGSSQYPHELDYGFTLNDAQQAYDPETRPPDKTTQGLSKVIRAFKSFSARSINNIRRTTGQPIWQRNYFDRIIRNQCELDAIRAYIADNPRRWAEDEENK